MVKREELEVIRRLGFIYIDTDYLIVYTVQSIYSCQPTSSNSYSLLVHLYLEYYIYIYIYRMK